MARSFREFFFSFTEYTMRGLIAKELISNIIQFYAQFVRYYREKVAAKHLVKTKENSRKSLNQRLISSFIGIKLIESI